MIGAASLGVKRSGGRSAYALVAALATACVVMVLGATAAHAAPKGVVGTFDIGNGTAGVAVNETTGDVYVVDDGNHRVQRFSSSGVFELAWGKDAVLAGRPGDTGTGFEVCTVVGDCNSVTASANSRMGVLGGEFSIPQGIAVDQSDGSVYVVERLNRRVQKFTADGEFVSAFGKDVVATGGVGDEPSAAPPNDEVQRVELRDLVTGTSSFINGGTFTLSFGGQTTAPIAYNASAAAVDAALEGLSSVGAGSVTVSGAGPGPRTVTFVGALGGTDVAQLTGDGSALVTAFGPGGSVAVSTTTAGGALPGPLEVCTVASDCKQGVLGTLGGELGDFRDEGGYPAVRPAGSPGAGNVIVPDPGNRRVQEFTSDGEFVRAFGADVELPAGGTTFEVCTVEANCKAAASGGSGVGQFANAQPMRVAADSTGAVYAVESFSGFRVQKFTPQAGPPALAASVFLTGASDSAPTDIAIGAGDNVLVSRNTPAGASTCPSGTASRIERRLHEYTSAGAEIPDSPHLACAGLGTGVADGLAINASTGNAYVTAGIGDASPHPRVFVVGAELAAPAVSLGISGVGSHGAQLNGMVDPNGPDTEIGVRTRYHFEFRKVGAPDWIALSADKDAGDGFAAVPVSEALEGLEADTAYEAKLVASRPFSSVGVVETAPETFTTQLSRPDVDAVYVSDRGSATATLNARINPNGEATSYRFEYGPTAAYGTTVPVPDGSAGDGTASEIFSEAIGGLAPDTTYHYRLIATNTHGATTSTDQTFTTLAAAQAPEGRAFELVSPADKVGGTGVGTWYAGVGSHALSGTGAREGDRFASMAYYGGSLANGGFSYGSDLTLGERTPGGWVNKPAFNRPGGFGSKEFAKIPSIGSLSDDMSLTSWRTNNSQMAIFEGQGDGWDGDPGFGSSGGAALREWESGRWEIAGPLASEQQTTNDAAQVNAQVAADGGYALVFGRLRGIAGLGDPTSPAFTGGPGDLVCPPSNCNGNVYVDDVTAGLSDSFPGDGIRALVNVCTGSGADRTAIPAVDGDGEIVAAPCPGALAGRDARLISPRGASLTGRGGVPGSISDDGSRVFFMAPDHTNSGLNNVPCAGSGEATVCPPQLYVRQRNADGTVTVRWVSESAVPDQDASLMSAAVFEDATPNGDKVFFRTASPLTADDPNGGSQQPGGVKTGTPDPASVDLYMYDFPDAPGADPGDGTLTRISAGPTGASDANVSTDAINSDMASLRAVGADGSRVYFVTASPLAGVAAPSSGTITTPGGAKTQSSTRNLYLYDAAAAGGPRWRFIAQLPASSPLGGCAAKGAIPASGSLASPHGTGLNGRVQVGRPTDNCVRATGDGSLIKFFTDGRLTVDDPDGVTGDVYAYDAVSDELVRLSAAQRGAAGSSYECITDGVVGGLGTRCHGDPGMVGNGSDGGLGLVSDASARTVFFESASRLVPEDSNDVYDVYQWRDGVLSLLSTGAAGAEPALYRGNDRAGTNVYISTRDRLTWQDHDSVLDVYVVRTGSSGIPQPDPPAGCDLLAGGCQGAGAGAVTIPAPGTAAAGGGENADEGARKRLVVAGLSRKARRAAARSGVLRIRVRSNQGGRILAVARARVGGRSRKVASATVRVRGAGKATLRLRLSRAARRQLADGRALAVAVRVTSPGASSRAMTVRLPGAGS